MAGLRHPQYRSMEYPAHTCVHPHSWLPPVWVCLTGVHLTGLSQSPAVRSLHLPSYHHHIHQSSVLAQAFPARRRSPDHALLLHLDTMDDSIFYEGLRNRMYNDYSGVKLSTQQALLNFITASYSAIIAATLGNYLPLRLIRVQTMQIVSQYEVTKFVTKDVQRAIIERVGELLVPETEDKLDVLGRKLIDEATKQSAKYAILSHRWGIHETTYQDILEFSKITTKGVQDFIKQHNYYDTVQYQPDTIIPALVNASADVAATPPNDRTLIDVLAELCDISGTGGFVNTWKLVRFCDLAHRIYGCEFAWIDTCCIDKTSSAELDESIRSMFRWYQNSHVCIVHLASTYETLGFDHDPWFTRGWTLQELLAPNIIKFHDQFWEPITSVSNDKSVDVPKLTFLVDATKNDDESAKDWMVFHHQSEDPIASTSNDKLVDGSKPSSAIGTTEDSDEDNQLYGNEKTVLTTIIERVSHITSIPLDDLLDFKPSLINIRNRLKWASKRETTRIEDQAYCLLGIFKVNMPIAYGEGEAAFHRLQATIIEESNDRSLFIWEGVASEKSSILAKAPHCFLSPHDAIDEDILADSASSFDPTFTFTNYGLRIVVLLYSQDFTNRWRIDSEDLQIHPKNLPNCRLAVLAYQLRSQPVSATTSFSTALARIPIVILLIEERVLNYVRYRRHPWRPRAVDMSKRDERPGPPEAIFIA